METAELEQVPQLIKDLQKRIDNNQNILIALTGATGSGKTFAAIRLGEVLSKQRDVPFDENNICLSVKDLIEKVVKGNLPKGSVLIAEEAGISANNRNWQSTNNKVLQFLLQTFRHRNLIVIFVAPDLAFVDKSSRKLMHLWFETDSIDRRLSICWCKPKWITINQQTGDFYFIYPNIQTDGTLVGEKMKRIGLRLPSAKLREAVDNKMNEYKTNLAAGFLEELEEGEQKKADKKAQLTDKQQQYLFLTNELKLDGQSSARVLGVTPQSASQYKKSILSKGYNVCETGLKTATVDECEGATILIRSGAYVKNRIEG